MNYKPWDIYEVRDSVIATAVLLAVAIGGLYFGAWFIERFVSFSEWFPGVPNLFVGVLILAATWLFPLFGVFAIWSFRPFYNFARHI